MPAPVFDDYAAKARAKYGTAITDAQIQEGFQAKYNADPIATRGPSLEDYSANAKAKYGDGVTDDQIQEAYSAKYGAGVFTSLKRAAKRGLGQGIEFGGRALGWAGAEQTGQQAMDYGNALEAGSAPSAELAGRPWYSPQNLAGSVVESGVNMAPAIGAGMAAAAAAPAELGVAGAALLARGVGGLFGGAQDAESVYKQRLAEGIPEEQARKEALLYAPASIALESLGLGRLAARIPGRVKGAIAEGVTEPAQQGVQNLITGKPLTEGMAQSAAVGSILGGGLSPSDTGTTADNADRFRKQAGLGAPIPGSTGQGPTVDLAAAYNAAKARQAPPLALPAPPDFVGDSQGGVGRPGQEAPPVAPQLALPAPQPSNAFTVDAAGNAAQLTQGQAEQADQVRQQQQALGLGQAQRIEANRTSPIQGPEPAPPAPVVPVGPQTPEEARQQALAVYEAGKRKAAAEIVMPAKGRETRHYTAFEMWKKAAEKRGLQVSVAPQSDGEVWNAKPPGAPNEQTEGSYYTFGKKGYLGPNAFGKAAEAKAVAEARKNILDRRQSDAGRPGGDINRRGTVDETAPPALPEEAGITNPIDPKLESSQKVAELTRLTAENRPIVGALMADLNKIPGALSSDNVKTPAAIIDKAMRPSIKAKAPWFDVEHIRDSYRFKTVISHSDQLPQVADALAKHGFTVLKVDTKKFLEPGVWGWRMAALDLRAPNGQILEWYAPFHEVEAYKKARGHQLFEDWRNKDPASFTAEERAQYASALEESSQGYERAFQAALKRNGQTPEAIAASLESFAAKAGSLTGVQPSSAPSTLPAGIGAQAPAAERIAPTAGPITKTSPSGEVATTSLTSGLTFTPPSLPQQTVYTPTGRAITVTHVVVDAGALITSDSQAFPQELQPRNRDKAASDAQVEEIARKLNPAWLGASPQADNGAPIVSSDGVVESGNGRVMALRKVYRAVPAKAEAYRAMLASLGTDLTQFQNPVLVRVRQTELSPAEREAFTKEANKPNTMRMSAAEQATTDAGLIDEGALSQLEGSDLNAAANRGFVSRFLGKLTAADRGELLDAGGQVNAAGLRRAQGALLAKAYGKSPTLDRLLESTDDEVRSVTGALIDAAPSFAQLRLAIENQRVDPAYDVTPDLTAAVETFARLREKGTGMQEYLDQGSMLGDDAQTKLFLRGFMRPDLKRAAARERVAEVLNAYAIRAHEMRQDQASMLSDRPMEPTQLLAHVVNTFTAASRPDVNAKRAGEGLPPVKYGEGRAVGWDARDLETITKAWGPGAPTVKIVPTAAWLPDYVLTALGPDIQASIDTGTGTIYMVRDQIRSPWDAQRILLHEAVGHFAMTKLLGPERWNQTVADVQRLKGKDPFIRKIAASLAPVYGTMDAETESAEIIAHLAEQSPQHPLIQKLIAYLREGLRGLGFNIELSKQDLIYLLGKASNLLERGDLSAVRAGDFRFNARRSHWDTAAFKRWFGKSKVVDDKGEPLRVYHGSTNNFDQFSPDKANAESWHGAGYYFSTSLRDVERNYANEDGADLWQKIESRAQQLDYETRHAIDAQFSAENGSEAHKAALLANEKNARDQALKELVGPGPNITPVYLSIRNPVEIRRKGGTTYDLTNRNTAGKIRRAFTQAAEELGMGDTQTQEVIDDIRNKAWGESDGEISAFQLDSWIRWHPNTLDLYTEEGDKQVGNELVRATFEAMGHDGVLLETHAAQWGKGMTDAGTVHYVAFKPHQIKSALANVGDYKRTSPMILASRRPIYHGTPHQWAPEPGFPQGRFRLDKIGTGEGNAAYGWGGYFSQAKGVAHGYWKALAGSPELSSIHLGPLLFHEGNNWGVGSDLRAPRKAILNGLAADLSGTERAILRMHQEGGNEAVQREALARLDFRIQELQLSNPDLIPAAKEVRDFLAQPGAVSITATKPRGAVYDLKLPDIVGKTLEWDKPMSQQPEAVRQIEKELGLTDPVMAKNLRSNQSLLRDLEKQLAQAPAESPLPDKPGVTYVRNTAAGGLRRRIAETKEAIASVSRALPLRTGQDFYNALAQHLGASQRMGEPGASSNWDKLASQYLAQRGVPALRYLTAEARGEPKGGRDYNLVIFDQATLDKIQHRGGNGGLYASRKLPEQQTDALGGQGMYQYLGGDKGEWTGRILPLHGGQFYEYKMLEGTKKGKLQVTQQPPIQPKDQAQATEAAGFNLTPPEGQAKPPSQGRLFASRAANSPHVVTVTFPSGMTRPEHIAAAAKAGSPLGVDIREASGPVMGYLSRALQGGLPVFVDSGAFSLFRKDRAATIDPAGTLAKYEQLALSHDNDPSLLTVVAPDKVGDSRATLQMLRENIGKISELMAAGLRMVVPVHGVQDAPELTQIFAQAPMTPVWGIPSNAAAMSDPDFRAFLEQVQPDKLHILGAASAKTARARLDAIASVLGHQEVNVSLDANLIRSNLRNWEGQDQAGRIDTFAKILGQTNERRQGVHISEFDQQPGAPRQPGLFASRQTREGPPPQDTRPGNPPPGWNSSVLDQPGERIGRVDVGGGSYGMQQFGGLNDQQAATLVNVMGTLDEPTAAQRRGTRTWDVTEEAALNLVQNKTGLTLRNLVGRRPGSTANAEMLEAYGMMMVPMIQDLHALSLRAAATQSNEDIAALAAAKEKLGMMLAPAMGYRTEAGRSLNILKKQAATLRTAQQAMDLLGEGSRENLLDFARKVAQAGSLDQVVGVTRAAYTPTWWDKYMEFWINGLLSGPATHVVNITSNAVYRGMEEASAVVGALTGSDYSMRQVAARSAAMPHGVMLGLKNMGTAFMTEEPVLDQSQKIEQQRYRAIGGTLGKVIRVPGRLLMSSDEFFKGVGYHAELADLAMGEAIRTSPSDPMTAFHQIMGDLQNRPEMLAKARQAAAVGTFTQPLGPVGSMAVHFINKSKVGRLIVPFMRTPTNIMKTAVQYTPAGLAMSSVREALSNGGKDAAMARGRMLVGSAIGAGILALCADGLLSGAGPDDPKERGLLMRQGWQPYSVKIGNEWVRYSRFDPLATVIGLTADMYELSGYMKRGEIDKVPAMLVTAIALNLGDKTFLRGVIDFAQAYSDPKRYLENWGNQMVASNVPTGLAQIARAGDPYMRQSNTIMDAVRERIPGQREQLAKRIDIGGDPIMNKSPGLGAPAQVSEQRTDPLARTMLQLGLLKDKPDRSVQGVELTDQEYESFSAYVGKARFNVLGPMAASPQFQAIVQQNPEVARALLNKQWEKISDQARMAWLYQNPQTLMKVRSGKAKPRAIASQYLQ